MFCVEMHKCMLKIHSTDFFVYMYYSIKVEKKKIEQEKKWTDKAEKSSEDFHL